MPTLSHSRLAQRSQLVSARSIQFSLRRDDLWRVELRGQPLPFRCLQGAVWITREDSQEDVIVPAGEECQLAGRGLALVGAVSDAVVSVGP